MKSTNIKHTPLAKLLPSLVVIFVTASLSTSATAEQISIKPKTPAQGEHALTVLLDSRSSKLQSVSYNGNKSSNNSSSVPKQAPIKKVGYSQKSIAELVLAGLAITSEAKYELSSPTSFKEAKFVVLAKDYAVRDIVSVEELDAYQEAAHLTGDADADGFTPIEETVSELSQVNNQIPRNIAELAEGVLPTLPAPVTKKLNREVKAADIGVEETNIIEREISEMEVPETDFVALEIAETGDLASISILEKKTPALLASLSVYTQASADSISNDTTVNISQTPQVIADKLGAKVNVAIRSEDCPANFNKVSIPVNGKLCQIFAADFPASMILFIPQTPEEVIQYYLASSDSFVEPKKIKKRTMLKSTDNNTTLIISKDGDGTQVDILVKSPAS
jgi:hypothetical protein